MDKLTAMVQQLQTLQIFLDLVVQLKHHTITLEPGLWSLSNFGEVLVATIANGKTFTWNAGITARFNSKSFYNNIWI